MSERITLHLFKFYLYFLKQKSEFVNVLCGPKFCALCGKVRGWAKEMSNSCIYPMWTE